MPIAYGSFSKYQNAIVQNDEQVEKKQKKKKAPVKRKSVKRQFDTVNINLQSHSSLNDTEDKRKEIAQ